MHMVYGGWILDFGFRIGEMECQSSWTSIEVIERGRRTNCYETDKGRKNNSVSGKSLLGAHKGKMKEGEAHSGL